MRFTLSLLVALFSFNLSAGNIDADFQKLKNNGEKYSVIGVVCEQVAKLRMQEKYPAPQYDVYTGIEYFDARRTIGELDVTVVSNETNPPTAVVVSEVKCWKNLDNARVKALDQRKRFQEWMASKKPVRIQMNNGPRLSFTKSQFANVKEYLAISQSGGEASGFEMTLDYTLSELMSLRQRILECQDKGACKAPLE